MKSNWTMYKIARALALERGPTTITDAHGNRACCYALSFTDLRELYARQGFNIRSVTWRNNIASWRLYGDVAPDEKTARERDDWYVCFRLDHSREEVAENALIGYMAKHDISKVIS